MFLAKVRKLRYLCKVDISSPGKRFAAYGPSSDDRYLIGNREVVGYGMNGMPSYIDRPVVPFPSVRFRACTSEFMALREKERGNWRNLTIEEKKCLYRASFCQTFAEMDAPDTEWKSILGCVLFLCGCSFWLWLYVFHFVLKDAPESWSKENRLEEYYKRVALNMDLLDHSIPRPPGAERRVHHRQRPEIDDTDDVEED